MNIISILTLFGGIGMFLFGMNYLGDAMKKIAGVRLEKILEKLTNNRYKGLALGTFVTAIIQSSTATAVIVLGFVNAGIMTLAQAAPVIFGANIGSTVTGQLLRLGDIASNNIFLTLLKPSSFAPALLAIGVIFVTFVKKKKFNSVGTILIGLGILFMGMTTMETAVAPLKESPSFQKLFTMFSNPVLGIAVGILVTAIVQSCSASIGILQALTATGAITWGMAIPIIIGMNVGKVVPVFISSLSTNREAKKVTALHLIFNLIGALLIGGIIYIGKIFLDYPFWENVVNRGNVADFNTLFSVITAVVLVPLIDLLIKLINRMIPADEEEEWANKQFEVLSDMFLKTPALALEQSRRLVSQMGEVACDSFQKVRQLLEGYDEKVMKSLNTNEDFLDRAETKVGEYLIKVTEGNLGLKETRLSNELLRSITDFERIGDYCMGIAEVFEFDDANGVIFSEACKSELRRMFEAVNNILKTTVDAYKNENPMVASRVEPLEEVIDSLRLLMEDHHVERLRRNICSVQTGISFKEILNSTDRIAGHCVNISVFMTQRLHDPSVFDAHQHLKQAHQEMTEEYKALYTYYETLYYMPVQQQGAVLPEDLQPEPEDEPAVVEMIPAMAGPSLPVEKKEKKEEIKPVKKQDGKKKKTDKKRK